MESVMAQEAQHLAEEARIRFGRTDDQVDRSPRIKISASAMAGHFHVCYTTCYSTRSFSSGLDVVLELSSLQQPGGMNTKTSANMIITCTILY